MLDVAQECVQPPGTFRPRSEGALTRRLADRYRDPVTDDDDDDDFVLPLLDDSEADLTVLLADRVFTHRITTSEAAHDFLHLVPDLMALSILFDESDDHSMPLADGAGQIVEIVAGYDDELVDERGIPDDELPEVSWLLPPGYLARIGAGEGDLVQVGPGTGGFRLVPVDETSLADAPDDLGARLEALLEVERPVGLDDLVWTACAQDPELFTRPLPPVGDLLDAAGLSRSGEQVAMAGFDFERYRFEARVRYTARTHGLNDDQALAVQVNLLLVSNISDLLDLADSADDEAAEADDHLDDAAEDDAGEELAEQASGDNPDPGAGSAAADYRDLSRDAWAALADPVVAEAFLTESIGRDAAALGLFAESGEPQAPRAARVALRWLHGKALERLGLVAEAVAAFDAAESMDPAWSPVLFDLARVASDRGNAEHGLSLLRRAGAAPDDDLTRILERHLNAETNRPARNDPCWCGSGRKSKQCHRGPEPEPLSERAAWLYAKAEMHVLESRWNGLYDYLVRSWVSGIDDPIVAKAALDDPLPLDAVLFEGGAFEDFVEKRGFLLPEDEQLLAAQWLLVERSVFDVEQVRPGEGLTLRDVRTGDVHEVRERAASRQLTAGMLICTRVAPAGDTMQLFGGGEPVQLHQLDGLLALLDEEPEPDEIVAFFSDRYAPPTLQNTEGDPLLLCRAEVTTPDLPGLVTALDAVFVRAIDEAPPRWHEYVTTHGMQRIRATFVLEDDRVVVESNSAARADRVLAAIRAAHPAATVVSDERIEMKDALAARKSRPPTEADEASSGMLDPNDPQVAEFLAQVAQQYEQAWLDDSIPALSGLTPRQAAEDPTRRPDLIRLLASFPENDGPGAMSPARLRAALGLV